MTLDELRHLFYTVPEPVEDTIRQYLLENRGEHGYLHTMYNVADIQQHDKYQGPQRLKVLVMLYNLVQEMVLMERIFMSQEISGTYTYKYLMSQITKVFSRVSSAIKYN